MEHLWGNGVTTASFESCIIEQKHSVHTSSRGFIFLFFKPHTTSFEHSERHNLFLFTLLNILNHYPRSSLTYINSCLIGAFSKLEVHPLTSKRGSPGRSPALTASLILGRMKQSTSRSPLSRDSQRETCCYFTLQLKKHTVVAGSLGAADLKTDFASCSLLSGIHKIHLE